MNHYLLSKAGEQHLLLGNEAIVRGALEAGVNMVSCYPGTPSSEVPDTFYKLLPSKRFHFEYSVNEKVALEVGAGAAIGGALTLVTMKHVGVNVAADTLMTLTYTGAPGGLVLLSADDPGAHSSQNEQDNRTYARFANMPCFEPSTAQELKDMTKAALLFARQTGQPVMLRTTTRVNHLRGVVTFGELPDKQAALVEFKRDWKHFVPIPLVARLRHKALVENIKALTPMIETCPFITESGSGNIGVIASGISRAYLHDVLLENNWQENVRVLNLGTTWPLPVEKLKKFMLSVEKLLVLEEGEPLLEKDLKALAYENKMSLDIYGKGAFLSEQGEYSTLAIFEALAPLLGKKGGTTCGASCFELPQRPPNLCAGCAHRSVFYAIRKIFGDNAYYSTDIGCYTLGLVPPLSCADFLLCMGSSVSAGSGFSKVTGKQVVAFIGDSTFFHSGMTGLVNAVFNKHDILLVILDNGTTAMTGHQPNPGMDETLLGGNTVHIDIESVVKGCGVKQVSKLKGYSQKNLQQTIAEMQTMQGVRVLIVEEPCVLFARRVLKKSRTQVAYVDKQDESTQLCLATLACQAFRKDEQGISVDPDLCAGCMVCMQISPSFKARKRD